MNPCPKSVDSKSNGERVHCSLNSVVGFWIEMVPRIHKPTQQEIKLHIDRITGFADKEMPQDARDMMRAICVLNGCADHRGPHPYEVRGALRMWPTRRQAEKAAITLGLQNEDWGVQVRIARKANIK